MIPTCARAWLKKFARGAKPVLWGRLPGGRDDARGIHLTGKRAGPEAAQEAGGNLLLTHLPMERPDIARAEGL